MAVSQIFIQHISCDQIDEECQTTGVIYQTSYGKIYTLLVIFKNLNRLSVLNRSRQHFFFTAFCFVDGHTYTQTHPNIFTQLKALQYRMPCRIRSRQELSGISNTIIAIITAALLTLGTLNLKFPLIVKKKYEPQATKYITHHIQRLTLNIACCVSNILILSSESARWCLYIIVLRFIPQLYECSHTHLHTELLANTFLFIFTQIFNIQLHMYACNCLCIIYMALAMFYTQFPLNHFTRSYCICMQYVPYNIYNHEFVLNSSSSFILDG